jgi:flagellar motility protein MotE (MotC chaperone)
MSGRNVASLCLKSETNLKESTKEKSFVINRNCCLWKEEEEQEAEEESIGLRIEYQSAEVIVNEHSESWIEERKGRVGLERRICANPF